MDIRNNNSHWLYGHRTLDKLDRDDYWKIGKTILPYTANRARQKNIAGIAELDFLFFGRANHITYLEDQIIQYFAPYNMERLNKNGAQTEVFNVPKQDLLTWIHTFIAVKKLDIRPVELDGPYTGTSKGNCPLECPSEPNAFYWCEKLVQTTFGEDTKGSAFSLPDVFYVE